MPHRASRIALLGSTGSIGRSTLEVVQALGGELDVAALSAHRSCQMLIEQARQFRPQWIAATDPASADQCDWSRLPAGCERLTGSDALARIVSQPEIDTVVAAIVGSAGVRSTFAAVQAGKRVALANKESLVVAGSVVMAEAHRSGAKIVPVDSEHSAVFQALQSGRRQEIKRVVLTASGGPFRCMDRQQMEQVTASQALRHPTWDMGPKITIDSATMMNKALEVIEARWLFDLSPDIIEVVVHPQSIVHSLVEFCDGSVLAQLSPPDMKLPIQYALSYPQRWPSPAEPLDLSAALSLDFEPADPERFPALELGHEVARQGGTSGAVVNGANEAAVAEFLAGRLRFTEIVQACRSVLEHHDFDPDPSLDELLRWDAWAREEVTRWVCT